MLAKLDISLKRDAPAFFICSSHQVLRDTAGAVARNSRSGQRGSGSVCRRRADDFGAAIILRLAPVAAQQQRYGIAQIGFDSATKAIMLIAIDLAVQSDVADIAVIFAVIAGETGPDIFAQGQVDRGATAIFFLGEVGSFDRAFKVVRRSFGYNRDHTGRRILPEQCALRPTQHFDALDIGQIGEAFACAAEHYAVEYGSNRGFGSDRKVDCADAAQKQRLVKRCARFAEVQAGNQILGIFERY